MKVIVAIDQTDYSRQIIDSLVKHSWPKDTAFKLITVIEPQQWEQPKWRQLAAEVFTQLEEAAINLLKKARSRLEEEVPDCTIHIEVRQGSAKDELLKAAIDWMPDKIVVGAHGHSPNRLLGSVPRTLSRRAPCSVELVRLRKLPPCKPSERVASTVRAN